MAAEDLSPEDRQRLHILGILTRDLPRGFWEDLRARSRQTYLDVFSQVKNDPFVLDEQRLDILYQQRHVRMEHLLKTLADSHGMAASATLLVENNRCYVYASKGAVGLTQAYVPAISEMPKAARFRERHSALNRIVSEPKLDFGLEAPEPLLVKEFYGLLAHNPVGKKFAENDQTLGMIQVCIPVAGCTSWAAEFTLAEIVAAYTVEKPEDKAERGPTWKAPEDDKKTGEGEG